MYISAPLHFFFFFLIFFSLLGRIRIDNAKGTWSNVSQMTSASGLSDWIMLCLGLRLYLVLFTCDPIAQDACVNRVTDAVYLVVIAKNLC